MDEVVLVMRPILIPSDSRRLLSLNLFDRSLQFVVLVVWSRRLHLRFRGIVTYLIAILISFKIIDSWIGIAVLFWVAHSWLFWFITA